jgi:hypothetical protein
VINLLDRVSRLKVESYPRAHSSQPVTADDFLSLRRAFLSYGLPQRLSLDHGSAFFDNTCPSPFPTRLHLWLLALSIEVVFIRVGRPTDHGAVERMHQTMSNQALVRQHWANAQQLWSGLDTCRVRLNEVMPMRALQQQAPRPRLSTGSLFRSTLSTGVGRAAPGSGAGVCLSGTGTLVSSHPSGGVSVGHLSVPFGGDL